MLRKQIKELSAPTEEHHAIATIEPPELPEKDLAVLTLKRQGASAKQIAKALSIHHSTVYAILSRNNEISSNSLASPELWDQTYRNYKKILQGKPIAKGLKAPDNTVILRAMEHVADRKEPKKNSVHIKKEVHTFIHLDQGPETVDITPESTCVQPHNVPDPVNKPFIEDEHGE